MQLTHLQYVICCDIWVQFLLKFLKIEIQCFLQLRLQLKASELRQMTTTVLIDAKSQRNGSTNKAAQPIRLPMTYVVLQMTFLKKYPNRHFRP